VTSQDAALNEEDKVRHPSIKSPGGSGYSKHIIASRLINKGGSMPKSQQETIFKSDQEGQATGEVDRAEMLLSKYGKGFRIPELPAALQDMLVTTEVPSNTI